MKKLLSIVIVIAILASVAATAFADQVWGDLDGILSTVHNNSMILSLYPGQYWEVDNIGVLVKESNNGGDATVPLAGTITADAGVTLSTNTWEVSGLNQFAYVNASGYAPDKPEAVKIYFHAKIPTKNDPNNIDTDFVTIHLNVAAADTTAPVIGSVTNSVTDWTNQDVTLTVNATDNKGVTGYRMNNVSWQTGPSFTVSENGDYIFEAEDLAGNISGKYEVMAGNIDKTAPVITGGPVSPANSYDWYNSDVTVSFAATDDLSGVASVTGPVVLSGEGKDLSAAGTAVDKAGNSSTATVTGINIDKTAPTVSASYPAANAAGWYNSDVTVNFSADDALSGVASVAGPVTLTNEGKNQSAAGTAADKAGNSSAAAISGINIDKTAPEITVDGNGPYVLNQPVSWKATDALSGVATAASGTIDTSKPGSHTAVITATDAAGNTAVKTFNYTVRYNYSGLLQPIYPGGPNSFKAGSSIPAKFVLTDYNGAFISTAKATLDFANSAAVSTSAAASENLFRYDTVANQYIFNLSTKGFAAGTYNLTVKLDDNLAYKVSITLK